MMVRAPMNSVNDLTKRHEINNNGVLSKSRDSLASLHNKAAKNNQVKAY